MNSKPTKEHLDSFIAHVISTLPDSIRLRKIILINLLSWIPRDYEGRFHIAKLLEALHAHEKAQLKFSIPLPKRRPPNSGDGHSQSPNII